MLHDRTLLKHGSLLHLQDTALYCSTKPCRTPSVRSEARNGAEDEQLTAIQHVHKRFVWLATYSQVEFIYLWGLTYTVCIVLRILRKGRSGVLTSTDFETMASHDVGAVYFTEYLSVLFQLTYLDKLYGECNGTARACVNSGYQALFSPITKSAWERG